MRFAFQHSVLIATWSLVAILTMTVHGPAENLSRKTAPAYILIDQGVVGPPPGQSMYVTSNGLVSLAAAGSDGREHAYLWFAGLKLEIGRPGLGGKNAVPFNVNRRIQAVGQADTGTPDPLGEDFCGFGVMGYHSTTTCQAFLWQGGRMTALPTLGGNNGVANFINKHGVIVGQAETKVPDPNCPAPQKLQFKAVKWTDGKAEALPNYGSDFDGLAIGMNDKGHAVGASGDCTVFNQLSFINLQPLHALLWEDGSARDLGNLGGDGHGVGNLAYGINNKDEVVGTSDIPGNASFHAFLWTKRTLIHDLGTLDGDFASVGLAINDAGDITGVSLDQNFGSRAFLYRDGKIYDLNSMISTNSSLALWTASSINSSGEIVGLAQDKKTGEFHGYLLIRRQR